MFDNVSDLWMRNMLHRQDVSRKDADKMLTKALADLEIDEKNELIPYGVMQSRANCYSDAEEAFAGHDHKNVITNLRQFYLV